MRLLFVAATLAVFLVGCTGRTGSTDDRPHQGWARLHYTQDPTTNLCFAWWTTSYDYYSWTNVPCTELVLQRIAEQEQPAR